MSTASPWLLLQCNPHEVFLDHCHNLLRGFHIPIWHTPLHFTFATSELNAFLKKMASQWLNEHFLQEEVLNP